MKSISILLFVFLCLIIPGQSLAVYDPLSVPNNKFGIHVADPNDISNVTELVNSSQGDWGYVTLVIPDNERKIDVWQPVFSRMKREHLIPIVRLATHVEGSVWAKPSLSNINVWTNDRNEMFPF